MKFMKLSIKNINGNIFFCIQINKFIRAIILDVEY